MKKREILLKQLLTEKGLQWEYEKEENRYNEELKKLEEQKQIIEQEHKNNLNNIKNSVKEFSDLVIEFNDFLLFELVLEKRVKTEDVYTLNSQGKKVVKDGIVLIKQTVLQPEGLTARNGVGFNYGTLLWQLRELAIAYFKCNKDKTLEDFKNYVDVLTHETKHIDHEIDCILSCIEQDEWSMSFTAYEDAYAEIQPIYEKRLTLFNQHK